MTRNGTGKANKMVENNVEDSNFESSKKLEKCIGH